ncbi:hypothetical protein KW782_02340 [Candidatus Parcubacteria bacterium]|nr:hypothetical protein [Candidatus Parcubacteria bacterium]
MNRKYWLRGGIIGSLFGFGMAFLMTTGLFIYVMEFIPYTAVSDYIILIVMTYAYLPVTIILWNIKSPSAFLFITMIVLYNVLLSFLIGSVIGWIYGKFKKQNAV